MTIKYLQNKCDTRKAIYKVDFQTKTYELVNCKGDMIPDFKGKFKDGGFRHGPGDTFAEVPKPAPVKKYA